MVRIPTHRPPTTPGEVLLEEFLKPHGLTQVQLAAAIGVSYPRVNEIIQGKRAMTPDTALRLERLFGASAQFWLNLQLTIDLYEAQHSPDAAAIAGIMPLGFRDPHEGEDAADVVEEGPGEDYGAMLRRALSQSPRTEESEHRSSSGRFVRTDKARFSKSKSGGHMTKRKDVHVSKDEGGGWKKTVGGEKVGNAHRTQQAAIDAAEKIAKKNQADLVVHGRDGKIRSKDSFGNDPKSIKDTEH